LSNSPINAEHAMFLFMALLLSVMNMVRDCCPARSVLLLREEERERMVESLLMGKNEESNRKICKR
jgi:putative exporter of polyketide antibiotics